MPIEDFAPAKINLTLHVTGRRDDGYHLLDSLVAFADIGDTVTVEPAADLSLTVDGPMAAGVPADSGNLVMRAARLMSPERGARITLTKRLPSSSGIGGGSSDAAATLRALSRLWNLPVPDDVARLGADVPVCMNPRAQRMRGIGETLAAVPALPDCALLLVNPGVSVATPAVFRALQDRENAPMPDGLPNWSTAQDMTAWLGEQRNDLQAAACAVLPQIASVLDALAETRPLFRAMSGSGATCFALYAPQAAADAERRLRAAHPDWWVAAGRLL